MHSASLGLELGYLDPSQRKERINVSIAMKQWQRKPRGKLQTQSASEEAGGLILEILGGGQRREVGFDGH